jgi:hypothetical protein
MPWRWPAWLWLAGMAIILFIRFPIYFAVSPHYLMDFEVYRITAQRLLHGEWTLLYQPTTSELMLFKYAPIWVVLWAPLGWLSHHAGGVVWSALTVIWLTLACWGAGTLCRHANLRAPSWLPLAIVLLLLRPITAEFLNGQGDVLWALLVIGFLLAEGVQQRWWAVISLSLAISLKAPALIFLAYLVARRRWSTTLLTLGMALVTNMIVSAALRPASPFALLQEWTRILWSSGIARAFEIGNQSLFALAGRLLSNDGYHVNLANLAPTTIFLITVAVGAVLFGLVVVTPKGIRDEPTRLVFDGSLLTILMILCSPTVWVATYSALVLPVAVAVSCAATRSQATWRRPLVTLLALAVVSFSLMTHSSFWRALGIKSFRGETYVFLVFMILPWLGVFLFTYLWYQRQVHGAR